MPPGPQALNDKKRLATSGANFARSRTVTDGTCAFPSNMCAGVGPFTVTAFWLAYALPRVVRVGCENAAETGNVKVRSCCAFCWLSTASSRYLIRVLRRTQFLSDDIKLECEGTAEGKVRRTALRGCTLSPCC